MNPEEATRHNARQKEPISVTLAANELLRQGNLDRAIAEYSKLYVLAPNSGVADVLIGKELFRQGKRADAIATYKAALPKSAFAAASAYEGLADLYAAVGRDAESIEAYRQIIYRVPGWDWADDEGRSIQARIQPKGQDWHSSRGTDTDLLMHYALLLSRNGRYAEALQVYDRGLKGGLTEEDRPLFSLRGMSAQNFDRRFFDAAALTAAGRTFRAVEIPFEDGAIAEYRKALARKSDFAPAHYFLGNALSQKGLRAEAKAAWQKAADFGREEVKQRAQQSLER